MTSQVVDPGGLEPPTSTELPWALCFREREAKRWMGVSCGQIPSTANGADSAVDFGRHT
jgi:hypothetical protein